MVRFEIITIIILLHTLLDKVIILFAWTLNETFDIEASNSTYLLNGITGALVTFHSSAGAKHLPRLWPFVPKCLCLL